MKVNKDAPYQLIFSVRHHPQLGPVIEPYVVELTAIQTLSLTYQKVFSGNAEYYDRLSDRELELIALLDPIMVENIIRTFSPVQRIRPKEYFKTYFKRDEYREQIRPFIEGYLVELLRAIEHSEIPLYLADEINPAAERIAYTDEPAKVLFHFRRNEQGTNYFATIKYQEERIPFMKVGAVLLSNKPAYLVVHSRLLRFHSFVEGNRLGVFLNRKFVHVRPENEEQYYGTFVQNLMERAPVFGKGFEIRQEQHEASAFLCLHQQGDKGYFSLQLEYGGMRFTYAHDKYHHIHFEWRQGAPVFTKVRRSKQWEDQRFLELLGMDLQQGNDRLWAGAGWLSEQVEWMRTHRTDLQEKGIGWRFENQQPFTLDTAELRYDLKEEPDWFDVQVTVRIGEFSIPFRSFLSAIRKGERTYLLPNGECFFIPEEWFALSDRFEDAKLNGNRMRLAKFDLRALEMIGSDRIREHLKEMVEIRKEEPHSLFRGQLRPYQQEGLSWLMFLHRNHFGGILADDMGLGKTVQTLAYIQRIRHETAASGPVLLVAPTSLLFNWVQEAAQFCPELKVLVHSGLKRSRSAEQLAEYDLVVTSYGLIRNDFEWLSELEFQLIVLDESQHIKNQAAKATQKVGKLKSAHRLCLTGTPIENSIQDLWSQMNFLNKGLLYSSRRFKQEFVKAIEKQKDPEKTELLRNRIRPFVLRRTKGQVAKDLPSLTEKTIYCPMDPEQASLYEEIKSAYRNELLSLVERQGMERSRLNVLQGLSKLRQLANHPRLLDPESELSSGKHEMLMEHIRTVTGEGHKVLVFSQFVRYLNILAKDLKALKIPYLELTGETPAALRKERVNAFQKKAGIPVFLISLKAGGVGLNLTAADYVFLVDPWWNPAAEAQARDRTHRIGQTQKVISYKFISAESVEEKIVALQKRKSELATDLIHLEENVLKQMRASELEDLLS